MPIRIYPAEDSKKELAWLSENIWDLPGQIYELEKWLDANESKLTSGKYVADIGFSVRENASGGGAVLSSRSMGIMAKLGITLFFSEYPQLWFKVKKAIRGAGINGPCFAV